MTRQSKRRELLSAVGIAGLGGLSGCLGSVPGVGSGETSEDGDVGGTDRTLKLGVMMPLSGDLGSVGAPIRDAAVLPVTQVEDDVDLEIDYKVADTETSPAVGVQRAADLVEAGYPMVTGAAASGVTLQAVQQVLIPYRTICCSPASTTPTITSLNDAGLVYRTALSDTLQAVVLADQAATDLGHENAATLYVNNDYGWQLTQSFSQAFRATHDGTVSAQVPVDEGQDSYADELEDAMEDDPELLVVVGYPDTGAQLFDDIAESDAEVDVLVTEGLQDPNLHEMTEHSIDGIRGTAPLMGGPGESHFSDLFSDTYGEEPGTFTAHAYDATAVLLLANAHAGQNDGTAIRNAVQAVTSGPGEVIQSSNLAEGLELAARGENVEYQGASSPVAFDENGDVEDATFEYWEFDESATDGIVEIDRVSS